MNTHTQKDHTSGKPQSGLHQGTNSTTQNPHFWVVLLMVAALLSLVFLPRAVAGRDKQTREESVERGEYLTTILGCAGCHTEGGLEGLPYGEPLAGSKIGIAYSEFDPSTFPAVVYPSNLTSHKKHGLGNWSKRHIARAIKSGINHGGGEIITVMPWMNYALLQRQDVADIVSYLQSLPAVDHEIPDPLPEGEPSRQPYMRIGVYHFTPYADANPETKGSGRQNASDRTLKTRN